MGLASSKQQKKRQLVLPSSANSNSTVMASSSNSNSTATGASSASGNQLVEWQWQTDDLRWRSYDASCSASIEAAHARGDYSVEISVDQGSTPTCVIYFQNQDLRQVNLRTQWQRTVRRYVNGQGSTAVWQWWESERNCWHIYDDQLASKFETAWLESRSSQRSNKLDCSAGLFFKVNGQDYSLSFEADGMQYCVNTSCCRSVRRYTYLPNQQPSSSEALAMEQCHSLYASTVSQEQARSNESEQTNSSKDEHSYLIACPNPNDGENCSVCLCSLQEDEAVELAKCHHFFHRQCITQWFKTRPSCPECMTIYGVITGTQPPGDMSIRYIPITSQQRWDGLQGYPGIDIIEITYTFPNGIQTAEHPSPGRRYTGTRRVAYLPKNKEGEEVLELLKTAWTRRLIFTVGTSVTTGRSDTVVWAGIHHKTNKYGGSSNYGYPDETYFDRVKKELALVNVI